MKEYNWFTESSKFGEGFNHFLDLYIDLLHDLFSVCIITSATSQEAFITWYGVERKHFAATFYAIPGFITVSKISVI